MPPRDTLNFRSRLSGRGRPARQPARTQPARGDDRLDVDVLWYVAGVGDTYLPSAYTRSPYYPRGLSTTTFRPALYDTFAIVTRAGARVSRGVRELLTDLEAHMRTVADTLDRSR